MLKPYLGLYVNVRNTETYEIRIPINIQRLSLKGGTGNRGNGETGKRGNGESGKPGIGETGNRGNVESGKRGIGESSKRECFAVLNRKIANFNSE